MEGTFAIEEVDRHRRRIDGFHIARIGVVGRNEFTERCNQIHGDQESGGDHCQSMALESDPSELAWGDFLQCIGAEICRNGRCWVDVHITHTQPFIIRILFISNPRISPSEEQIRQEHAENGQHCQQHQETTC